MYDYTHTYSLSLSLPPSSLLASLFVEKLPKHPEYSKALPADKTKIKKLLKVAFPRAMELKQKLKAQYEKEKEDLEAKEKVSLTKSFQLR